MITVAEHEAAMARDRAVRPGAEKLCGQYIKGLLTIEELIQALIVEGL
jgi:hypothetical protein